MIVILTLANKPQYLPDAIASVRAQTRLELLHIVDLDDGHRDWGGRYPPAVFFNEQASKRRPEDYLCWLSDDDLLLPNYIQDLAGFLDAHPEVDCCYGASEIVLLYEDGRNCHYMWLPQGFYPREAPVMHMASRPGWPIYDPENLPACEIDGGMIMVRRSALDKIEYPYMNESPEPWQARVTDGHVLNKIATAVGIYPVGTEVMINRITPESAHCRPGPGGQRDIVDWRGSRKWNLPQG